MSKVEPNLVYPNQFNEVTLVLDGAVAFNYHDFVVTFSFFDEMGEALSEAEVGTSYSEKLVKSFRYLEPVDGGLGNDAVKPVYLKRPATRARVEILPWKNKSADAARDMQKRAYVCVKSSKGGKMWTRRIGSK